MCVIYVCNTSLPPEDELKRGQDRNSDGAGISWLAPDPDNRKNLAVYWQKGLKDDTAVKKFIQDNKIPFPLIIHFRTASVGGTISALTHPFPTIAGVPLWEAGYAQEVLFHNGHLSNWDDLVLNVGLPTTERFPDGPWSDTRALAWLTYLKGPGVLDFVIKSSRVVLMHSDMTTLPDENYDKMEDHITLFGSGWIHKVGYSQSIATLPTVSGYKQISYNHMDNSWGDDTEDLPTNQLGSARLLPAGTPSTIVPVYTQGEFNVWTIDELSKLIIELEGEQNSAKLAAGI
jgi:hypothetical protein